MIQNFYGTSSARLDACHLPQRGRLALRATTINFFAKPKIGDGCGLNVF